MTGGARSPALSVLAPFAPTRAEDILPYAAMVQWSRAGRLWQGQSTMFDPHLGLARAALAGFRVPVGIGVTLMPLRHPLEAALQARSLAMLTGHPVLAGFGPGARALQRDLLGRPYPSPLAAVRGYLTGVRTALGHTDAPPDGDRAYPVALPATPAPPVEIGLGVLRPGAAAVAGELADAAITWLTPPGYVRDVLVPALRAAARAAGRPVPRVVAMVPFAVAGEGRTGPGLALVGNAAHLRLPHYRAMLRRAGVHVDPGDPEASAGALVDGRAFLFGDAAEVAVGVKEYVAAGVDEIVLNPTGVAVAHGHTAALRDVESVLEESL